MTIAACYLSSEGVVLGADSTSTVFVAGRGTQSGSVHQYNFAQKVFEFGPRGSTVGVALWGLGSLGRKSWRTLVAEMADEAHESKVATLKEVASIAATSFGKEYEAAFGEQWLARARSLQAKDKERTPAENAEYDRLLQTFSGGICLGGRWGTGREPSAFEIQFDPSGTAVPEPAELPRGTTKFWGCPNLVERLIRGTDFPTYLRIVRSGKWSGTREDLIALLEEEALGQPYDLPIREAIDWIYASIYTTIKAMKFSHLAPVCGGPIEVAVITSDRPFRWVRHKHLGQAIAAHETREVEP